MSADIHRQRRRVATPLTIPFTASPRGQVNEDRFGDMGPVPNFMLRQSKNVTYASPTARLQRAIATSEKSAPERALTTVPLEVMSALGIERFQVHVADSVLEEISRHIHPATLLRRLPRSL